MDVKSKDKLMQNILVLGANGLIGHKTVFALHSSGFTVFASAKTDEGYFDSIKCTFLNLDVTKFNDVKSIIKNYSIDCVVNCAAYTNVDKAESEKELCNQINALFVDKLAKFCELKDLFLVHISTDYVFDGSEGPYAENDTPKPLSVYGSSKLAGDNSILSTSSNYCIFRAIVVYGCHTDSSKLNFITWLIQELESERQVRIVDDQIGTFTFAEDLVQAIVIAIQKNIKGIYNISGDELLSRYEMSNLISDTLSLNKQLISPIKTSEFKQAAKRPLKSGFKIQKAIDTFGFRPTNLRESTKKVYEQMNKK